jgi:hypothetical protein
LPQGIPSHDTFNWVFRVLAPRSFADAFLNWVEGVRAKVPGDGVALDRKADYVLAAFAQPDSDPEVILHFATEVTESGHGRKECRRATAIGAMKHLPDEIPFLWPTV